MPKKDCTIEFYPQGKNAYAAGATQGQVTPTQQSGELSAKEIAAARQASLEEQLRAEMEAKNAAKKPAFGLPKLEPPSFKPPAFQNPFAGPDKSELEALRQKALYKGKEDQE